MTIRGDHWRVGTTGGPQPPHYIAVNFKYKPAAIEVKFYVWLSLLRNAHVLPEVAGLSPVDLHPKF